MSVRRRARENSDTSSAWSGRPRVKNIHPVNDCTRLLLLTHFFFFCSFCFVCFAGVKVAYSVVVIRNLLLSPRTQGPICSAGCMLTSRLLLLLLVVDNDTRRRALMRHYSLNGLQRTKFRYLQSDKNGVSLFGDTHFTGNASASNKQFVKTKRLNEVRICNWS